jgi:hypothetical protein
MKNSTYSRLSDTVSTVQQSQTTTPAGLAAEERLPGRARSSWSGIKPVTGAA